MSNVANLADRRIKRSIERDEPCIETVISTLEHALNDLKSNRETATKVVIFLLDDQDGCQFPQIYLGGVKAFEAIGVTVLGMDDLKDIARGDMEIE